MHHLRGIVVGSWPEHVRDIVGNDVCVALAYRTPAGGVVLTPVSTMGMFDDEASTMTTTTSFGFWKKLVRIAADDRVALVYHARDHSGTGPQHLVVAQGHASFPRRADSEWATPSAKARLDRFVPPQKHGWFWDWLGREYYEQRVPLTVRLHRMAVYSDDHSAQPSEVIGAGWPRQPASQEPPAKGTAPRVPAKRYAKRLAKAKHLLVGYTDHEGFPMAHRVGLRRAGDMLHLDSPALPPGMRRAGLLAHWFGPQLVGQGSVLLTGWLDVDKAGARYAPHTTAGYEVPASQLLFSVGGATAAKLGYRQAVKAGHVADGSWRTGALQ
jgi:hypothetical protein